VLDVFRLKWFLPVLTVVIIVVVAVVLLLPPRVTVNAQGTVAISNTTIPQFDIVSISDIPAYGVIEKSGCGEFKGRVKIRIDCYLTPVSPYYEQYGGAYVPVIPPEGYTGKVDEEGNPVNPEDYQKWLDSLPTVWQDNPFHSHFVYFDDKVTDDQVKAEVVKVTEYFYAFHTYCWDNELTFLSQWVKVPKQAGTIRDVFIAGDSSPPNKSACEVKATDISTRKDDFDTRQLATTPSPSPPLNIGEKGTIDVGYQQSSGIASSANKTIISMDNPSNADGIIDTMIFYASQSRDNCEGATFIDEGSDVFSTRDNEALGTVSGLPDTITGLSIDILTGDYIGAYNVGAYYNSGGAGMGYTTGDLIPCSSQSMTVYANFYISIYGTGTEGGGGAEITNTPDTWSAGIIGVGTSTYTAIDHFTIENTGTGAVDVTIQGTDLDNGGSTAWDLADDGVPDTNVYGLWAGLVDDEVVYEYYETGYTGSFDAQDETWLAQTFTPSVSHRITTVKLYLERTGSPGDLTVGIRNTSGDAPTGADLCYETVDGDLLADSLAWVEFDMGAGYDLIAGTKYAIVIRCPNGGVSDWILWGSDASATSTYAGGWHYESTNSGVDWSGITYFDFYFEEWGDDYSIAVPESSAATLIEDLAEDATQDWGMRLFMPTSVTGYDTLPMTATVTLVASAAS
jgi:hypothetical protein